MSEQPVILLDHVTLLLPVRHKRRITLRRMFALPIPAQPVGGQLVGNADGAVTVAALKDFSLAVNRGERVGLIGHNGAGKSTLLRIMAGIYYPSSGACEVRGKVSTLFTSSLGMDNEATGLENIYLSGLILGLSKREIERLLPDIAAFSELGEYLRMPFRSYSSGMKTRLGFAVATSLRADVLLIDEVIGAGDRSFQHKARARLENMMGGANTLVIASHADEIIREYCNKAVWIEHGQLRASGDVQDVLNQFNESADHPSMNVS